MKFLYAVFLALFYISNAEAAESTEVDALITPLNTTATNIKTLIKEFEDVLQETHVFVLQTIEEDVANFTALLEEAETEAESALETVSETVAACIAAEKSEATAIIETAAENAITCFTSKVEELAEIIVELYDIATTLESTITSIETSAESCTDLDDVAKAECYALIVAEYTVEDAIEISTAASLITQAETLVATLKETVTSCLTLDLAEAAFATTLAVADIAVCSVS